MWSRIYLTPLLQAEEDRDQARRYFADQAREKTLLGTQSSAYNSDRYVCRSLSRATLPGLDESRSLSCLPYYRHLAMFVKTGLVTEGLTWMFCGRFVRPTFTYTPSDVVDDRKTRAVKS